MHPAGAGFFGTTGESGIGRVNSKKPAIEEDTCAILRLTGQDATAAADPLATWWWWWHNGMWKKGTWQDDVFVPVE
jgi:hypothetical protein